MEFTRRCSVCGKIYCYTDQDLKDSKTNAVAGAIGAIGTIASVFGGTPYQTFELDKMSDRAMNKMIDYEKCPNCGSSRTVLLTADELAKYKSSDHTTPVANPQMPQMVPINTNASTESLVERGMLFLEDQEWDKANAYFENVLDADPKNVQAYIGKLLVDLRISRVELLDSCEKDFTDNPNYKKALRFSTEKEKEQLESINKERIYKKAKTVSRTDYKKAIELLGSIKDYKDAPQLIDSYSEIININIYEKALSVKESESISQLTEAADLLDGLGDYKEAKKIAAEYRNRIEELKAEEEKKRQEEEKKRQEEEKKAAAIAEERAKQAAKEAEILRQQREKRKKHIIFASVATIAFIAICAATIKIIIPNNKYNAAVTLMDNGDYDAAIKAFEAMADYKDSAERIKECKYCAAVAMMGNGDYEEAKKEFKAIGDYKDSAEQIEECKYNIAISSMNSGNFIGAYQDFENIIDYKDSAELQASIRTEYEIALISKAEVGDIVHFGMYEQDNIDSNGSEPIDWVVLEKSQNKTLLISNYVLDCYPFNKEQKEVTWEKSDVREWLNSTFYESAFSKEEQSFIQITHVKADDNPHYGTSAGNSTEDKLFYLSVPEVIKYSSDNGNKRIAFATPYAIAEGVEAMENGYAPWGLRTPGSKQFAITAIARNSGAICGIGNTTAAGEGFYVDATGQGVRPAMWIDGN